MALSIAQLLTPLSRGEALDELLAQLDALGFAASSWQAGSKRRTIVEIGAMVWADMSLTVRTLTEAVFLVKASGPLLTGLCRSHYDLERSAAIATRGNVVLTAAAGAGPYTITVGQLVVSDEVNGYTYRNRAGGTLAAGGTLTLEFEAEVAGDSRNLPINTLTVLQTPLAGVTANNPGTGVPAQWITRNGADEQTDASLRLAAISRWSQLSIEKPADGYIGIALGVPGVARVEVDATNPGGEGTVDVWCAGTNASVGTGPGSTLEAVQTALDAKRAVSAIVTARAAGEQTVDVTATVHVDAAFHDASYELAVEDAIRGYINGLPIGGQTLPPALGGFVDRESLIRAIVNVEGTVGLSLPAPAADASLSPHTIATVGTVTLTFVDV
jgi:uncharacterized phage protein gp47/JayE